MILKETGEIMSYMNTIKYVSIPFLTVLLFISFPLTVSFLLKIYDNLGLPIFF